MEEKQKIQEIMIDGKDVALSAAVVILNWNGEELLSRFLPSVVEHTPAWVDIVVADNGSTDGSLALLSSQFDNIQIVRLDKNYGFAEGYNRALAHLSHEYFILLNSDIEVVEGWCEPLFELLSGDETIGAVAPKILSAVDKSRFDYAGAAGGLIDYLGYPYCRGRVLDYIEQDCGQYDTQCEIFWASGAAFACRASLFGSLGGFDSDLFAHQEEIDLAWRMQLAGYRIVVEPRSRVYHLGGGTLNSGSAQKCYLNHRNNLIMLHKCASLGQLLVVGVARPFLDLLAALSYLLKGRFDMTLSVFKAWRDHLSTLGSTHRKRQAIQSGAVAKPKGILRRSIFFIARSGSKA